MGTRVNELVSSRIGNALSTVKTWGGIIVNVREYGAKGDGKYDDTSAIQLAINSQPSGTLLFPPGKYKIGELKISSKDNYMISGYGATLESKDGTIDALFNISNVEKLHIEGLRFTYPNRKTYSNTSGLMVKIDNYRAVYIRECEFINIPSHAVWADNAKDDNGNHGTTFTNVTIRDCFFKDQYALDNVSAQSAIYLGVKGEYALILNNEFRKCQSAIRGFGGANTLVDGNTIMSSLAPWSDHNAVIYFSGIGSSNSSKIIIANNRLNHNNSGLNMITCVGNDARNEQRFTIVNNHLLVNGTPTECRGIWLVDADYSIVTGNYIIPNSNVTDIANACVSLSSTDYAIVDDNTFQYSLGILLRQNSKGIIGRNTFKNPRPGMKKIHSDAGCEVIPKDGVYNYRLSSAGALNNETDNKAWTSVKNGTGSYTITHNLGHINYTVAAMADNAASPIIITVTRTASNLNLRAFSVDGTPVDANITGMVKVSLDELSNT